MSLGAAACLVLMFSWQLLKPADVRVAEPAVSPQDSQVALAWAPVEQAASDNEESLPTSILDPDASSDFATPSWLIAALAGEEQETAKPIETEIN